MRRRGLVVLLMLSASTCLFAGCGGKPAPEDVPVKKLSQQELDARIREIQNSPAIPANDKPRLIEEARIRAK